MGNDFFLAWPKEVAFSWPCLTRAQEEHSVHASSRTSADKDAMQLVLEISLTALHFLACKTHYLSGHSDLFKSSFLLSSGLHLVLFGEILLEKYP